MGLNKKEKKCCTTVQCTTQVYTVFCKGSPPSTDLRYGEEDSISPSTLIFAAIKG